MDDHPAEERRILPELDDEAREWILMTPVERYLESCRLWSTYLLLGGSLDPQPDSESPFDFPEMQRAVPPDGRSGVHFVRRGGI